MPSPATSPPGSAASSTGPASAAPGSGSCSRGSGSPSTTSDAAFASYLARYERGWRAFPDVEDALRAITARGLRTAVLTNGADAQQRAKLAAIGLADRVGPVFSADAIGAAKPAAAAFHHACEALGVAPGVVVSVGDRHDLDVVAARAAGLQAVHLDRRGDGPSDETRRIRTLSELGDLLGER